MSLVYRDFSSIDGVIIRTKNGVFAGINKNLSLGRKRFTVAHELGHYLLHEGNHTDAFHMESELRIEREANRFAGELLMPEKLIRTSLAQILSLGLANLDTCSELSWIFKVSKQAMKVRLEELKISVIR